MRLDMRLPGSDTPQVTFVVLCYNTEPFVAECIESILAQQGSTNWEIVAVDDCSTDSTAQVLGRFKDPRLRVIRHVENRGHAESVTEALRLARGTFVARIDSDDRYRPDFLLRTLPIFEKHAEVGLVYGDAALINADGEQTEPSSDRWHQGKNFKGNELVALLEQNFICAPTVIARREAWLECLPAPNHLAFHDWYFTVNIAREYEFYYLSEVLADYRVHANNLHSAIVLNKTEEPSLLWLLDHVYRTAERMPELEGQKQRAKRRVYATHYWVLANKYFGANMSSDARRCYLKAIGYLPQRALSPALLRRLIATFMKREWYERSKLFFKSAGLAWR